jgi:hypothetical protein
MDEYCPRQTLFHEFFDTECSFTLLRDKTNDQLQDPSRLDGGRTDS